MTKEDNLFYINKTFYYKGRTLHINKTFYYKIRQSLCINKPLYIIYIYIHIENVSFYILYIYIYWEYELSIFWQYKLNNFVNNSLNYILFMRFLYLSCENTWPQGAQGQRPGPWAPCGHVFSQERYRNLIKVYNSANYWWICLIYIVKI